MGLDARHVVTVRGKAKLPLTSRASGPTTLRMHIVCLSDTHDLHGQLQVPDGDLLIHAGDATMSGTPAQIEAFDRWLGRLPHRHKVVIAGNHDWAFQRTPTRARSLIRHATYLEHEEATVEGLRIWGSPWQPWFFDWVFNLQRGPEIAAKWARIPDGIHVLARPTRRGKAGADRCPTCTAPSPDSRRPFPS